MDILLDGFRQQWEELLRLAPRLLVAVVLLLAAVGVGRLLGRGAAQVMARAGLPQTHLRFFRALSGWLGGLVGLVMALNVLQLQGLAASLVAGGGFTAVALGFAFREVGENFLAGFFLAFSRPFRVGDLIESDGLQGVVRGIELRYTHVRTSDGRDIYIPSSQIFKNPLVNYTRDGLRRPSFTVGIDYGDDADAARELLLATVRQTEGTLASPEPVVSVSALQPAWVELEVSFWIDTLEDGVEFRRLRGRVIDRCRRALLQAGFTLSSDVTTNIALKGGETAGEGAEGARRS